MACSNLPPGLQNLAEFVLRRRVCTALEAQYSVYADPAWHGHKERKKRERLKLMKCDVKSWAKAGYFESISNVQVSTAPDFFSQSLRWYGELSSLNVNVVRRTLYSIGCHFRGKTQPRLLLVANDKTASLVGSNEQEHEKAIAFNRFRSECASLAEEYAEKHAELARLSYPLRCMLRSCMLRKRKVSLPESPSKEDLCSQVKESSGMAVLALQDRPSEDELKLRRNRSFIPGIPSSFEVSIRDYLHERLMEFPDRPIYCGTFFLCYIWARDGETYRDDPMKFSVGWDFLESLKT